MKCRECCKIEDRERWYARKSDALVLVPEHAERFYDRARGLYSLTAMHKAAGEDRSKEPSRWLVLPESREFMAELTTRESGSLVEAREGRNGGTWAHWQVAIAYAKYLSPAFHIQWNEYAAAYLRGEPRTVIDAPLTLPSPHDPIAAIEQVKSGLMTLFAPALQDMMRTVVDAVFIERFGVMPQQVAETHATVRGATRIEIVQEVTVDGWASDGHWYIAVNERDGLMSLGETTKDPPMLRLEDGDYNGNKAGDKCWVMLHSARTDKRKAAQTWIQQMARQYGCRAVGGDRFAYDPEFAAEARRLIGPIRLDAMKQRAADDGMFLPPLFRSA
jgi:hypothetical protein